MKDSKKGMTEKKGFKRLLAKCMAAALYSHARKRKDLDDLSFNKEHYKGVVKRLERDVLNEEEGGFEDDQEIL